MSVCFWWFRRRGVLIALYFVLAGAVVGASAYMYGPLGGVEKPFFSIVPALPTVALFIFIPLVWHALLTLFLPTVYVVVYIWRNPTVLHDSRWLVLVTWSLFAVVATITGAWIVRRLLYFALQQRITLVETAVRLRSANSSLVKVSGQRADAITRLLIERNTILEQERGRLARDLHDELGQRVAAMNIDVHLLRRKQEVEHDPEIWDRLQDGLAGLIKRVREIVHELRPQALEEGGFAKAVEAVLQPLREGTEIRFSTNFRGDSKILKGRLAEDLFRIVTESITNVVKHSGATEASVDFYFGADGSVFGSVRDNGAGLASQTQLSGMGLVGMGDRLQVYGGRMFVESTPSGFEVHIAVPPSRKLV